MTASTRRGSVASALASDDFVRILGRRSALRRLLVILDVCYAGAGVLDAVDLVHRAAPQQRALGRGEGIWIMAAARAREEARQGRIRASVSRRQCGS